MLPGGQCRLEANVFFQREANVFFKREANVGEVNVGEANVIAPSFHHALLIDTCYD